MRCVYGGVDVLEVVIELPNHPLPLIAGNGYCEGDVVIAHTSGTDSSYEVLLGDRTAEQAMQPSPGSGGIALRVQVDHQHFLAGLIRSST